MNVKFRMPKLSAEQIANPSGNGKSRGIVRELLLTTIATTISIVLTFGTAAWFEKREADKATRLLAMTIISDIDKTLEVYQKRVELEDNGSRIANYLFQNIDDSRIRYSEEVAKNLPELQQELVNIGKGNQFITRLNRNPRTAQATNLDHSGTRLELSESETPPVHYQRRLENQ